MCSKQQWWYQRNSVAFFGDPKQKRFDGIKRILVIFKSRVFASGEAFKSIERAVVFHSRPTFYYHSRRRAESQ